mgnify:CR=1 FL=1
MKAKQNRNRGGEIMKAIKKTALAAAVAALVLLTACTGNTETGGKLRIAASFMNYDRNSVQLLFCILLAQKKSCRQKKKHRSDFGTEKSISADGTVSRTATVQRKTTNLHQHSQ